MKRFVAIWFHHLITDWLANKQPHMRGQAYVFARQVHGRAIITACSVQAEQAGIGIDMPVADARAILPSLVVYNDKDDRSHNILHALAEWCIRFTPIAAVDEPDGIVLDMTGCAHLWGGEVPYLKEIILRLRSVGYHVRAAIADTVGTAWGIARYGNDTPIIAEGQQMTALRDLPPAALRLPPEITKRLHDLGLTTIGSFITMPAPVLQRRFGAVLLLRLRQALGQQEDPIKPVVIIQEYVERLPCIEPIQTAPGIEIALTALLEALCKRLQTEGKGVRKAILRCYRIDGVLVSVEIGTNRASTRIQHLFDLFEPKITEIEPALGIELFILEAVHVEDTTPGQEQLWGGLRTADEQALIELLDKISNKYGIGVIRRYLAAEHHWPEWSFQIVTSTTQKTDKDWITSRRRPVQLIRIPVPIKVTAPIPDYPPMQFRYMQKLHDVLKADGPERIEREWWLDVGEHRDYYTVENADGERYWVYRSGHYSADNKPKWFLHGFFA